MFATGLAVVSVVLVFALADSAGLFTRHVATSTATPRASVSNIPIATPAQSASASSTASSNASPLPKKNGAVTGVVLDEQGNPIWGASVWGGDWQQPFARDITDQSGQFALDKTNGPNVVTVSVDGFASDQQQFNVAGTPEPLIFKLSRIPPLNVRVVDESGRGVAGVELCLQQWWGQLYTLADCLTWKTDGEGRIKWTSPPKGELEVHLIKLGYRYSRTNKLTADAVEHVVILHPVVRVHGSVTDADTGDPVPIFKITKGNGPSWLDTPLWDLRSAHGSNGVYRVTVDEEQRVYLRLEAEGYETLETEVLFTNETNVTCDLKLNRPAPARSIRGVVRLPDGNPAAGVEVALCTAEIGVKVRGTTFEPGIFGNAGPAPREYRRVTDAQGSFLFDLKPDAHTVVALSSAGIGQARCLDASQPLEIRLQPWGRIEGTVRTRDGNWGGQTVCWSEGGRLTRWMTIYYEPDGCSTRSDETGAFTLEHVPPGFCRVGAEGVISGPVEVLAGQTAHVQVGGAGRAVAGKLVAPPDVPIRDWTTQVPSAFLSAQTADYGMPKNMTDKAAQRWLLEYGDSPAGRDQLRAHYSYPVKIGGDGSFRIPEVLPGKYDLFISVVQGNLGSGPDSPRRYGGEPQIAQIRVTVTVPEDSGNNASPVDLGEVLLHGTR